MSSALDSDDDFDDIEDGPDEAHYVHGVSQSDTPDDENDGDNEAEAEDEEMATYRDDNSSSDESDEASDDEESDIGSIPDDDPQDGDVGASILGDMEDNEAWFEMSFQELQQRLEDTRNDLRQRDARIKTLEDRLSASVRRESNLQQANEGLTAEVARLKDQLNGIKEPPVHWRELFAQAKPRDVVWRAFAKQNNMSQRTGNRHPDLHWGETGNGEPDDPGYESADSDVLTDDGEALVHPQDPTSSEFEPEGSRFVASFDMLPHVAQERIFRYLFVKTELVHCISRLDPDGDDDTVFHRFHFGLGNCTIRRAHRPASILKYLLVSKRWLFMGVNCFFSQNTFAFSSLGEFGSFMAWLPRARRERMQHIEIFWQGSIMPRHDTRINQRTLPLTYLCKTPRLKTLVVHIQEIDNRTRRRYERLDPDRMDDLVNDEVFEVDEVGHEHRDPYKLDPRSIDPYKLMKRTTGAQPNTRASRSMRTCHGMDYVYQLRGMRWVRFKQTDVQDRQNIRDWSFVEDLNAAVTRPKAARDAGRSELENLFPISGLQDLIDSFPADADWEIIYRWYGQTPLGSVIGDTQGAPSIAPSEPEASTDLGINSDDEDDQSSDDDSDDGSDGDSGVADLDDIGDSVMGSSPGHGEDNSAAAISNFIDLTHESDNEESKDELAGLKPSESPVSSGHGSEESKDELADLKQSESPVSSGHGSDNNAVTAMNFVDLTHESEEEEDEDEEESLFVRSDNTSDIRSRSESLFVRSDTSSGGVKKEEAKDEAQKKRLVVDLTTIDEETEGTSQNTAGQSTLGAPKQKSVPYKVEGQL